MANIKDLIGKRSGRIVITGYSHRSNTKKRDINWSYLCDCGVSGTVLGNNFASGKQTSCGCGHKKKFYDFEHPLYQVWKSMKQRCYNPKEPAFHNYGGRGITVCDLWKEDYQSFYDWAVLSGYKKGLCIDKDILDKNNTVYCPEKCQWVTRKQNNRAKRNNKVTPEILAEIKNSKLIHRVLAVKYGISKHYVFIIKHNKHYIDTEK